MARAARGAGKLAIAALAALLPCLAACGPMGGTGPGDGVETSAGDGTYTLVASEGLPPASSGNAVTATATLTVGP